MGQTPLVYVPLGVPRGPAPYYCVAMLRVSAGAFDPSLSVAATLAPGTVVTVSAARLPTFSTGLAGALDGSPVAAASGLGVLPLPMWLTTFNVSAAVVRRVARSGT